MIDYGKMQTIVGNINNTVIGRVPSYSPQDQIRDLKNAFQNRKLVLVLGAGISEEHGLPGWDILLQKLLFNGLDTDSKQSRQEALVLAKVFTKLFKPSPLIAARYLKNQYDNFKMAVKETLYEGIDTYRQSEVFREIKRLCTYSPNGYTLDSVITYNYDDILEWYLSKETIGNHRPHKSIYSLSTKPDIGEIPIYHVHGFLPQGGDPCSDDIVLSEDVYHQQYNDSFSWNNFIQINKFTYYTCLFIGVSLTDPNLRRLLDIAKNISSESNIRHYIIREKYKQCDIKDELRILLQNDKDLLKEKLDAKMTLGDTDKSIVKMMENFQESDAASFNVGTIWVDDYAADIPKKLKAIRS